MKLIYVIQMYKRIFRIQGNILSITQKISDILYSMLGNGRKFVCVSQLISIILHFNALCDAHAVYRHYTMILKSDLKFCLLLGIIFGNDFLTKFPTKPRKLKNIYMSSFVYFLIHQSFYEKIHC